MSGGGDGISGHPVSVDELSAEIRRLRADIHRMQAQLAAEAGTAQALARAEAQLAEVTAELSKARASSAYRLGQILVEGVRRPARAPVVVPRDLARLWKARHIASRGAPVSSTTASAGDTASDPARLHVDFSAHIVTVRDRPVIAGVLARGTARTVEQAAHLSQLQPNDALRITERTRPDLLLVESAAARWGPWAHLGTYAAIERDRLLLRLLESARAIDVPSVLWLNTPDHENPGLRAMSGRFDLVVRSDRATIDGDAWSTGISLRDLNPVGLAKPEFDLAVPADARPIISARIDGMTQPLRVVEVPDAQHQPERLPHIYRSALSYLAVPPIGAATSDPDGVWRALACGAHVVAVAPGKQAAWVDEDLAAYVQIVADHDAAAAAIRSAVQAGRRDPRTARELLHLLRERRSVQARLATILDLVDRGPFVALAPPRVEPIDALGDSPWVAVVHETAQAQLTSDPRLLHDLALIAECVDADAAGVGPATEVATMLADTILVVRRAAIDAHGGRVPDRSQLEHWARAGRRLVALAAPRSEVDAP